MNVLKGWRQELRVQDLGIDEEIEVRCKLCGKHRYEFPRRLIGEARLGQLYIDELQDSLRCYDRYCNGPVVLAIMYDTLEEGFVAGMP